MNRFLIAIIVILFILFTPICKWTFFTVRKISSFICGLLVHFLIPMKNSLCVWVSDAGKSTIGGQILLFSGQVVDRTIQKYEKEAKDKSRDSLMFFLHFYSFIFPTIIVYYSKCIGPFLMFFHNLLSCSSYYDYWYINILYSDLKSCVPTLFCCYLLV